MAEFTVAQAALAIVPDFSGVVDKFRAQGAEWGQAAGSSFSDSFNEEVGTKTNDAPIGPSDEDSSEKGRSSGGKFADSFKTQVDLALRSLPTVDIDGNSTDVDNKINFIRLELESLSSQTVGLDISDEDALAKIGFLQTALTAIGSESESIQIKVDTGDSAAKLATIAAAADAAGGSGGGPGIASGLFGVGEGALSATTFLIPLVPILAGTGSALIGLAGGGLASLPGILAGIAPGIAAIALAAPGIEFLAKLTFDPLVQSLRPLVDAAILPSIAIFFKDLVPVFQALSPFVVQAAAGIGALATQFGAFLSSKEGLTDLTIIFQEGALFMNQLGHALLTLAPAFTTLGAEAAPIVNLFGQGLDHLATSFANWVSDGGFEKFVQWFIKNGPPIVKDIENLISGVVKLGVALTPLGTAFIHDIGDIGNFIGSIAGGVKKVEEDIEGFGSWVKTNLSIHGLLSGLDDAVDFLNTNVLTPVENFFKALPGNVATAIGDFFGTAWADLKSVGTWIDTNLWQPTKKFFTDLPGNVATAIGDFFGTAWKDLTTVLAWLGTNLLDPTLFFFGGLASAVATAIGDFFTTAWADLLTVATWLDTNVWTPTKAFFTGIPGDVAKIIVGFYDTAFADLTGVKNWLETNVWTPISSWFTGLPDRIAIAAAHMWDGVANAFIGALNSIINVWDNFKFPSVNIPFIGKIGGFGLPHIDDISLVGQKADGGPIDAFTPYIVGERGPELIVPPSSGYVVPNHDLSSLAAAGGSSSPSVLQHVENQNIYHESDATSVAMQLAFLQRGRRF